MADAKGCTRSGQVGSNSQSALAHLPQKLRSAVLISQFVVVADPGAVDADGLAALDVERGGDGP